MIRHLGKQSIESKWAEVRSVEIIPSSKIEDNLKKGSLKNPLPSSPKELWSSLFPDELIREIVERTNLRVESYLQSSTEGISSRDSRWRPLDSEEFRRFIGVLIIMGIDRKPRLDMYWDSNHIWDNPLITRTLKRYRFEAICKWLTCSTSEEPEGFEEVELLVSSVRSTIKSCYEPANALTIDESMIGFKGKHSLKQCLPMKPTKLGFKTFVLADATNGYVCDFRISKGSEDPKEVCLSFLSSYEHLEYHVYTDSWYSSIELAEELLEKGIFFTGTMKKSRMPYQIVQSIQRGLPDKMSRFWRTEKLCACIWNHHKVFPTLSNYYGSAVVSTKRIHPLMVFQYNKYMRGMDLFDQSLQYCAYCHRLKDWWKKVMLYIIDITIFNSFVLLKVQGQDKSDYLSYRIALATQLIGEVTQNPEAQIERHLQLRADRCGRCVLCLSKKIKSNTAYKCSQCDKYLHTKCFEEYHTNLNN